MDYSYISHCFTRLWYTYYAANRAAAAMNVLHTAISRILVNPFGRYISSDCVCTPAGRSDIRIHYHPMKSAVAAIRRPSVRPLCVQISSGVIHPRSGQVRPTSKMDSCCLGRRRGKISFPFLLPSVRPNGRPGSDFSSKGSPRRGREFKGTKGGALYVRTSAWPCNMNSGIARSIFSTFKAFFDVNFL